MSHYTDNLAGELENERALADALADVLARTIADEDPNLGLKEAMLVRYREARTPVTLEPTN